MDDDGDIKTYLNNDKDTHRIHEHYFIKKHLFGSLYFWRSKLSVWKLVLNPALNQLQKQLLKTAELQVLMMEPASYRTYRTSTGSEQTFPSGFSYPIKKRLEEGAKVLD